MTATPRKISLLSAILININILISAGIFLNARPLTDIAGPFGFWGYPLSALILLPFVITLARLAQKHPKAGGLYVYSKEYLGRFAGFVSSWSYFVGKTTSAAFLAFAYAQFLHTYLSVLHNISPFTIALGLIFLFIGLNIVGVHIGGRVQYLFVAIKATPIVFVVTTALLKWSAVVSVTQPFEPLAVFSTIPIAVYALIGFEATTAISHLIKDREKNVSRAIIFSFLIVAVIATLFQFVLYRSVGHILTQSSESVLLFAQRFFAQSRVLALLMNGFVFTAAFIGSFVILTSNCWNLHTLAADGQLPGKKFLTQLNAHHVPWVALIAEGVLACLMLLISNNQIALQSMSVFAVILSFVLSSVAAIYAFKDRILAVFAFFSCSYVLILCVQKIIVSGVSFSFLAVLLGGIVVGMTRGISS